MSADAWLTLVALAVAVVAMATGRASTVVATGGAVVALLVVGVLDVEGALSGFGSEAPWTIAALYVLAGAASATGAFSGVVQRVVGRPGRANVSRLGAAAAGLSSVAPNTPLVALLAPQVVRWCRRHDIAPSSLLMPLSFASVLGGVVTVIGTSTNLIVADLLERSGEDRLGIFEITPVGLPVAVVGVTALGVLAPRLLPERQPTPDSSSRSFHVTMRVVPDGPLTGRSVAEAGLRQLDGLFLAAIERGSRLINVDPGTVLEGSDRCVFVGDVARVVDLHDIAGLESAERNHVALTDGPGRRLYEAVVGPRSELAGSTLKDVGFRGRYHAAVLAVHRAAGDLPGKLGTIELRAGDVLLVLAGAEFETTWRQQHDFALVAALDDQRPPPRRSRSWVVAVAFVSAIALAATGVVSLLEAALIGVVAVILGGAVSTAEAARAVNLDVVFTIAAAIGLGAAVQASGLAAELAGALQDLGEPFGGPGELVGVLLATMVLTELLSNNAAAAVMVPVALAIADAAGDDPRPYAIAVLVGASCSFLSPIGYQTNLMVYGLGGYRFSDFARLGLPLTAVTAVVTPVAIWVWW